MVNRSNKQKMVSQKLLKSNDQVHIRLTDVFGEDVNDLVKLGNKRAAILNIGNYTMSELRSKFNNLHLPRTKAAAVEKIAEYLNYNTRGVL